MTVAKGLTAGYAPMGAAIVSDHVYQVIADAAPNGCRSAMASPIPAIPSAPQSASRSSGSTRAA